MSEEAGDRQLGHGLQLSSISGPAPTAGETVIITAATAAPKSSFFMIASHSPPQPIHHLQEKGSATSCQLIPTQVGSIANPYTLQSPVMARGYLAQLEALIVVVVARVIVVRIPDVK